MGGPSRPSDSELQLSQALSAFWIAREAQADKQRLGGKLDAGLRGAVTGGGHLDALRDLIAGVFEACGIEKSDIRRSQGLELPGYYRPTKKWDLVIMLGDALVAAIELKSQVGPSFGNNFNNRTEEAIGNAVDVRRAYEEGTFGAVRPWLAYVFVLERAAKSTSPVNIKKSLLRTEDVFVGTSYADRYRILCNRLVEERLYDAAWFVMSTADGQTDEPDPGLSLANLRAAIADRVRYVQALQQ